MARFYSPFWITVTSLLCVVFAILLYPAIVHRYGVLMSLLFTGLGVIFIWMVYFVRAWVFGRHRSQHSGYGRGPTP
jgi:hypothetical protein